MEVKKQKIKALSYELLFDLIKAINTRPNGKLLNKTDLKNKNGKNDLISKEYVVKVLTSSGIIYMFVGKTFQKRKVYLF